MSTPPRCRRLFLRLSALSDEEYAIGLEALKDVLDIEDADEGADKKTLTEQEELAMEGREVSLKEVRGWMKGRFRDVKSGDVDKVRIDTLSMMLGSDGWTPSCFLDRFCGCSRLR